MPILFLIRHGENDFSKKGRFAGRLPGVHLNERGRQQAEELAKALAGIPLKAVYSSPLERAVETAEPIARAHGLKVLTDEFLKETNIGKWQGRSIHSVALNKQWRIVQSAPSRFTFPEGESFHQNQARTVEALNGIIAKYKPRDLVAVVFHADPIKLAVAHYIGLPLDNFQRLGCDTASVTMLAVGPSTAHLLWLNRRPPFELKLNPKKK